MDKAKQQHDRGLHGGSESPESTHCNQLKLEYQDMKREWEGVDYDKEMIAL